MLAQLAQLLILLFLLKLLLLYGFFVDDHDAWVRLCDVVGVGRVLFLDSVLEDSVLFIESLEAQFERRVVWTIGLLGFNQ